jgi:hypothetical protein
MSDVSEMFGVDKASLALKDAFLRWQCRVRMMAMRDKQGRPDDAVMPDLFLPGESEAMGQIITVLSKSPMFSKTPELKHMVMRTNDPAQRREKALQLFSETYFQKSREFSDVLTASFAGKTAAVEKILAAQKCRLHFSAYNQTFEIACTVSELGSTDPMYQSTWWHNHLFNPDMSSSAVVVAFAPLWSDSNAEPPVLTAAQR